MKENGVVNTLQEHQGALYELLMEFDRVCRELDVKYTLFSGTLLGAVRHKGFIPWDDDLDVIMLRKDYDKFLKYADNILNSKRFYLQKEFSEHFPMFFSKLRINGTTCLEKYYPRDEKTHMGVYMDIFPCDNAAGSELGRKIQFYASKVVIAKSLWKRGYITDSNKKKLFMKACRCLPNKPFLSIVKRKKSSKTVHSFFGAASDYEKNIYPLEWLADTIKMSFEGGEFPVSSHYHKLLTSIYGDYMAEPSEEDKRCKVHAVMVDLNKPYEDYAEFHRNMDFEELSCSIR